MNTLKALILIALTSVSITAQAFEPLDKIIAIVDDDVITQSDFATRRKQVEQNLANQQQRPSEEEIRQRILDQLIVESIQLQLAERSGVKISNERLTETMHNIAKRNNMTLEEFKAKTESQGISYPQMRAQIKRDMLIQNVRQGSLRNRIQISEAEVDTYLASADGANISAQKYNISHILWPLDSEDKATVAAAKKQLIDLRKVISGNEKAIQSYVQGKSYKGHKLSGASFGWQQKQDLPSLFASYVDDLDAKQLSQPIRSGAGWHLLYMHDKVGGSVIEFQTNSRHILIKPSKVRTEEQTQALINSLYERAINGEDFGLLAKEYSEDTGSALQGGELGWSGPGKFVPAFEQALAKTDINGISRPFKSQFGWHIIQKLGEREHDITKEGWKNQAYQALYERKFADELDNWIAQIRSEAFIEIKE